jgi:hypothetical protein
LTFDKTEYYLGEKATVSFTCDNTQCSKDVKGFKLKLFRQYKAKDPESGVSTSFGEYCSVVKFEGCGAYEKVTKSLAIKIPTEDKFVSCEHSEDELPLLKAMTTSVQG